MRCLLVIMLPAWVSVSSSFAAEPAKPNVLFIMSDDLRPVHVFGGEPERGNGEYLMALVPLPTFASPEQRWERAAPRGRLVLQLDAVELSGTDWSWVRLRVIEKKAGAPGRGAGSAAGNEMTEIEITAPREY